MPEVERCDCVRSVRGATACWKCTLEALDKPTLVIVGRRWRQRSTGNTYCRAEVYRDGEHVSTTPITLGYGDFYVQFAVEHLIKRGILPPKLDGEADWQLFERLGIKWSRTVSDVAKERDL